MNNHTNMVIIMNEKLSEPKHKTTIYLPTKIKEHIPDSINLSGLTRDLLLEYIAGKKNEGEWQKGFRELYLFFKDISRDKSKILYNVDLWNKHLKARNLPLIDKLAGEL